MTRSQAPATRPLDMARAAVIGFQVFAGGGCSLPISIPLSPIAASGDDGITTGSIGADVDTIEVDEEGVSERVGIGAWTALKRAVAAASEAVDDGQSFAWRSNEPGMSHPVRGTVTAIDAFFAEDGAVCRRLAITATAYLHSDAFIADACRRGDGGWKVRPVDWPAQHA